MYMRGVMMVIHCVIFIGVNDIPVVVLLLCRRTFLISFFRKKDLSFSNYGICINNLKMKIR